MKTQKSRVITGVLAVTAGFLLVQMYPELRRYLRMRRM
jgi:hypothetical protein